MRRLCRCGVLDVMLFLLCCLWYFAAVLYIDIVVSYIVALNVLLCCSACVSL